MKKLSKGAKNDKNEKNDKTDKNSKNDKKKTKNSKENTSNNLTIIGQGQTPEEINRNKRRFRREINALSGSIGESRISKFGVSPRGGSRTKTTQALVPGPGAAMRRLDQLTNFDVMSNYFQDTRPWKQPLLSNRASGELTEKERQEILAVGSNLPLPRTQSNNGTLSSTGSGFQRLHNQLTGDSNGFVQAHVCPICMEGFEPAHTKPIPAADTMKTSMQMYQQNSSIMFRKNLEDGWGVTAKPKKSLKPHEVVVAADCGELFHKVCLKTWCSELHKSSTNKSKATVTCPSCRKELKYTSCLEVEVDRHLTSEPTTIERKLIQTKAVNKELQVLWPESSSYLAKLQNDIKEAETRQEDLIMKKRVVKTNLKNMTPEDLSIVMSKVTDPATMKTMLERQEKALEFMQQETLQIMRMYLLTILRKRTTTAGLLQSAAKKLNAYSVTNTINNTSNNSSESQSVHTGTVQGECSPTFSKIPPALIPHLQNIMNDDHSLHLLSRILVPMPDDFDEPRLKLLELEILQKHDPNHATRLTRTNTYTVLSSIAEVGETESEGKTVGKKVAKAKIRKGSSLSNIYSASDTAVNLVKAVSAHYKFPTEQISCIDLLMNNNKISNSDQSMGLRKPKKLINIQQVSDRESDLVTINSSAEFVQILEPGERKDGELLEKKKVAVPVVRHHNTAEIDDDEEEEGAEEEEEGETNDEFEERLDYISPLSHYPLAPSYRAKRWLELKDEDSRLSSSLQVSAISLKSQETIANQQIPASANFAEKDEMPKEMQQLSKNIDKQFKSPGLTAPVHSNRPSSNTLSKSLSDTNLSLGQALKLFQKQSVQSRYKDLFHLMVKSFDNDGINSTEQIEEGEPISEAPPEYRNEKESDSCWSTIPTDEDGGKGANKVIMVKEMSPVSPNIPDQIPTPLTHSSSCQLVFSNAERKNKLKGNNNDNLNQIEKLNICRDEAAKNNESNLASLPEKQVSIAIMYIVDDDGDEEVKGEERIHSQINSQIALDHRNAPVPPTLFQDVLTDSFSGKLLTPVYMNAEKASNYSNIADQVSSRTSLSSENGMILDLKQFQRELPPEVKLAGYRRTKLEADRPPVAISSWTDGFKVEICEDKLHLNSSSTHCSPLMRSNNTNNEMENYSGPNQLKPPSLSHVNSLSHINKTHTNEIAINKSGRLLANNNGRDSTPFQ